MKRIDTHITPERHRSTCTLLTAIFLAFILAAGSLSAGTICGTVRDLQTGASITMAGIFVRTTAGAYTGYHGATNDLGEFCIDAVPPGTYDLEVRVDNYVTGYLRNVEVTDDPTSVRIDVDVPVHFSQPWPNPAQESVSFNFRSGGGAPVRLLIYDPLGRLVHGWIDPAGTGGERVFNWNLRDGNSMPVPSGVYFAQLTAGEVTITRSIAIVR